jgi:putative phosphonate metabolism protein
MRRYAASLAGARHSRQENRKIGIMAERYAVYYAPPATGDLWERASLWLGRDAATGVTFDGAVAGMDRDRLLNFTASPNRYGFHATLRAPMHLRPGADEADLTAAVSAFASEHEPVAMGPMTIAMIDGFLAIVPQRQAEELTAFAQSCVEAMEPLRAPLGEKEYARRMANPRLSARHRALVDAFGYPYVAEHFRFHMTLTDRLEPDAVEEIMAAAQTWFAPVLAEASLLDSLSIFVEPKPGHAFRRAADFPLMPAEQRLAAGTKSS